METLDIATINTAANLWVGLHVYYPLTFLAAIAIILLAVAFRRANGGRVGAPVAQPKTEAEYHAACRAELHKPHWERTPSNF